MNVVVIIVVGKKGITKMKYLFISAAIVAAPLTVAMADPPCTAPTPQDFGLTLARRTKETLPKCVWLKIGVIYGVAFLCSIRNEGSLSNVDVETY